MKTLTPRFPILFGIALLAVAIVISFASCKVEPGNFSEELEIPSKLQKTEWAHTSGDSISFDSYSVTVIPSGETQRQFWLKKVSKIDEINQTTLFFSDDQTKDHIVYRNDVITMVNFSIIDTLNRSNGWSEGGNPTTPIQYFHYIAYYEGNNRVEITRYTGSSSVVIIPAKINELPVTKINMWAFPDKQLTSVTIPGSVKAIASYAFINNNLTSITIGGNVSMYQESFDDNFYDAYTANNNSAAGTYIYANGSWSRKIN